MLEMGRVAYLMRGMRMVAPHLPLLLFALSALFANSLINIFLPSLQVWFSSVVRVRYSTVVLDHVINCRGKSSTT